MFEEQATIFCYITQCSSLKDRCENLKFEIAFNIVWSISCHSILQLCIAIAIFPNLSAPFNALAEIVCNLQCSKWKNSNWWPRLWMGLADMIIIWL
jgi:hypothetical protein